MLLALLKRASHTNVKSAGERILAPYDIRIAFFFKNQILKNYC